MSFTRTGRFFCDTVELRESGMTEEECTFELLTEVSPEENLCDAQADGNCEGDIYYTDDHWAMTKWCKKHWEQHVKDGTFKEITK